MPGSGTFVMPAGAVAGVMTRPAKAGETIVLWGIGFGPVDPPVAAGTAATSADMLTTPVQVSFGSVAATVTYAGLVPGTIGVYQFNVMVPDVADNPETPFTLTLGGQGLGQTLYTAVRQ